MEMPARHLRTPARKSAPQARAGAIPARCLTWIVDSTALAARYRSPAAVSTPAHRPRSRTSAVTRVSVRMTPPWLSITRASAVGSAAEPPLGSVQLCRCLPNGIE